MGGGEEAVRTDTIVAMSGEIVRLEAGQSVVVMLPPTQSIPDESDEDLWGDEATDIDYWS